MSRLLPLLSTLLGVNFWLIALLVPLLLARSAVSPWSWVVAPLAPLALLSGLGFRQYRPAQILLIIGVPLLCLLPTAEGVLASAKFHPPAAVAVQLLVLVAYLVAVCADLARGPKPAFADVPPSPEPAADSSGTDFSAPAAQLASWHLLPKAPSAIPTRLRRRIATYRLQLAMCVAMPVLFLYAINGYPDNVRALRVALGSPARAAAMQAALTAGVTTLWSVLFHFFFMVPMDAHLDHDRKLRSRLQALRESARRGRPRLNLYLAILVALLSMGLLIWWSL